MSNVNEVVYQGIVDLLKQGKKAIGTLKSAKDKVAGIYTKGMELASTCQSFEVATATFEALVGDVPRNVDGLAVAIGGEPRKEPTKDGQTHKLPEALSTLKSAVLFAFEHGIPFHDDKGELISFTALRKIRTEMLQTERAEEAKAERAALTGIALARVEAVEGLARIATLVQGSSDETAIREVHSWASTMAAKLTPKPVKAPKVKKTKGADVAAELSKAA
jgi:hypothetical protein